MAKLKNIFSYLAPLLAILGGLIYFIVLPSYSEIKRVDAEIADQLSSLEEKNLQKKNFKENLANFSKIDKNISELNIFINKGKELDFISQLESLADKYQVEQTPNIGQPQNEGSDLILPVQLTLVGNYNKILNFLNEMEKLDYYLIINTVEIAANETIASNSRDDFYLPQKSSSELTIKLSGKVYYK